MVSFRQHVIVFAVFSVAVSLAKLQNGGKIWVLLVAGSNGYDNYRHQADICHAYQVVHNHGIPDENIIVMMYDDIAHAEDNPTPGVIINEPNGTNVYPGVLKDYTKEDVTPKNFLKVLTGDEYGMSGIGSGRVIKSGPNDHVFVNFADHGAPGLLAFPSDELYAKDLEYAFKTMQSKQMFSKLVMYVEACESGSMFDSILPEDMNIFVTTAADPQESSYACYFDDYRGTYLGDVYSVMWMQDSDEENLNSETLHHQYQIVRTETNTSHVEEYGDLNIGAMHVSDFQGLVRSKKANGELPEITDEVSSRDVPVEILGKKIEMAEGEERRKLSVELHSMLKKREHLKTTVAGIVKEVAQHENIVDSLFDEKQPLRNFACHEKVSRHFSDHCYKYSKNPHALSYLYVIVNLCEGGWNTNRILQAMDKVCSQPLLTGIV